MKENIDYTPKTIVIKIPKDFIENLRKKREEKYVFPTEEPTEKPPLIR